MEVVIIEKGTFEELTARLGLLVNKVECLRHKTEGKRLGEWLDSAEVCQILQISPRTLQTLRDNGTLGYSQVVRKVFYRAEDVKRIIPVVEARREKAVRKGGKV